MLSDLIKNKISLVTGASRGIGKGIAKALGEAGATVIGTATTKEGAQSIREYLQSDHLSGDGMVLNVKDASAIEAVCREIKDRFGPVEILVNNAAITADNLLMRMREEEWQQVIDTNLTAIFRLTKTCIRDMLKAKSGRIISISSVVGTTGNPGQANYSAAKAGVEAFSKSLALEVGSRNITVNTIAPGFIDTDMTRELSEEQKESIFSRIPLRRAGTPQDIAALVVFLASEYGNYITGQTLHVNGGMYMN